MGVIARGNKMWLQIGKQAVAGTPVAATGYRLPLLGFTLDPVQGTIEDETMVDQVLGYREIQQAGLVYTGTMSGLLGYIGYLKILEMMMGDQVASPPTPTVAGPTN